MKTENIILDALLESRDAVNKLIKNEETIRAIAQSGSLIIEAFKKKNRIFSCGNGGSMCDSIHFAEELSGRYRDDRKGLPAIAIADPGHITCVGNDYGYEYIFSRYLQAHARGGDILVAISTSGNSPNVVKAAEYALSKNIEVIALTGNVKSKLSALASIEICTPVGRYADRVQEVHIKVIHILIELVERTLFPENYSHKK